MRNLGQLFLGLLAAAGSSLIILAAASLALVEGGAGFSAAPSPTLPMIETTPAPGETALPTATQASRVSEMPASATPTEYLPTACPAPAGWVLYVIRPGDTIESLAEQSKMAVNEFRRANCLTGNSLIPNSVLFMPSVGPTKTASASAPTPLPTLRATITPVPCGPPYGWILYIVRPGDTIFRLSLAYGVSQEMLLRANCMVGTRLLAGQTLFVPNVATRVPPTEQPTRTVEPSLTRTATTEPDPTEDPGNVMTPTPTATYTATHTATATETAMPTATATATESPSATASSTESSTGTQPASNN